MEISLKEFAGSAATVGVGLLAFYQWRRARRGGQFLADREKAYKDVWLSLEEANLFVRTGGYTRAAFNERLRDTNTLVMKHELHLDEGDHEPVRRYLAAMQEVGRVLTTDRADRAFERLREDMATTAPMFLMEHLVPEYRPALRELDASRRDVVERFRNGIGAAYV